MARYRPSDIMEFTLKTTKKAFANLTQWKRYLRNYKTIAGTLLHKNQITREICDGYFWLGIHVDLRKQLERQIFITHPRFDREKQFPIRMVDEAASWFFSRNRAETMMVNASAYGVVEEDDDSDKGYDESDEESDDSDYGMRRRRQKKKPKAKNSKESAREAKTEKSTLKSSLKTTGTAEEVTGLIRQLNKMSLEDPEYSPVYYKVLALDQTGIAAKCVQPPRLWNAASRTASRNGSISQAVNTTSTNAAVPPNSVVTYPNNIPLRSTMPDYRGCFGCDREGHRMNDCVHLNELLKNQVVAYDKETGKLRMRDGTYIRKQPGESLVEAARRIATPRVMFGTVGRSPFSHAYYKTDPQRARLIDEYCESDNENYTCQNGLVSSDGDRGYQTELYDGFLTSDTESDDDGPTRIPLTVGEALALSKEIRNGIQDHIRLKNVKAVLIGKSSNNPLLANWTWQRTEGILIRVEMEVGGRKVMAIIDTGSQLDVVRADVAVLIVNRPVDMTCVTNMNDANGGRGQLQGLIKEVEFSCGGVRTKTDLWMSQQAPFELLLGRPWQRSNLVTIDEREEGTYLVFKDPVTRQPRYELLAIPHEGSQESINYIPQSYFAINAPLDDDSELNGRLSSASISPPPPFATLTRRSAADDSCRHTEDFRAQGYALGTEAIQLIRVLLALGILIGGSALIHLETFIQRYIEAQELKRRACALTSSPPPQAPAELPSTAMQTFAETVPPSAFASGATADDQDETQVLSRQRLHEFGPRDLRQFDGDHPRVVQLLADHFWLSHLAGDTLPVRPAFIAAPQFTYLGYDEHRGQEVHYSVMLNARMLIYNPVSGAPGSRNGHAEIRFRPVPEDETEVWDLEVPYVSDRRIKDVLEKYAEPEPARPEHIPILEGLRFGSEAPPLRTFEDKEVAAALFDSSSNVDILPSSDAAFRPVRLSLPPCAPISQTNESRLPPIRPRNADIPPFAEPNGL
ncbi:hypothetical protein C8J57DRAFT_1493445 [Mycena rebaudengoi]|nr:hypothetical protein C8J57DRAFT_1493445 [Mycena rebaudengoi]